MFEKKEKEDAKKYTKTVIKDKENKVIPMDDAPEKPIELPGKTISQHPKFDKFKTKGSL